MRTLMASLLGILSCSATIAAREWSDNTGKYHVAADFVEVKDNVVFLRDRHGALRTCKLARLSEEDRAYVFSRAATRISIVEGATSNCLPDRPATDDAARSTTNDLAGAETERHVQSTGPRVRTLVYRPPVSGSAAASTDRPQPEQRSAATVLDKRLSGADTAVGQLTGFLGCRRRSCYPPSICCPVNPCPPHPCPPCPPCPPLVDYGKRIYKGDKCRFHLVSESGSSAPKPQNGTVEYIRFDTNGCCHRHLQFLNLNSVAAGSNYVYTAVPSGNPVGMINYWLIVDSGTTNLCDVFWWTGSNWTYFDTTCRQIPE